MATVLITGGTGLIGNALTKELVQKRYNVIILTRDPSAHQNISDQVSYAKWDIKDQVIDEKAVAAADYIVHLAGANVAEGRWIDSRKKEIVESRTRSGDLLVKALKEIPNKVKAVISASAIGWYGPDETIPAAKPFVETDPADASFLGQTCMKWERSIEPVMQLGKRLVILRTGIVLSNEGGAYAEFKKPLKLGVAGILGNGRQMISWIHINDMAGLYLFAIENENLSGIYNAVAPQPVSNQQLVETMKKERGGFGISMHVPAFVLKAALGEMSIEVLKSTTVSSKKTEAAGYSFIFPNIEVAVRNLNKKAS